MISSIDVDLVSCCSTQWVERHQVPPTFPELNGWLETVQEFGQKVAAVLASAQKR